MMQVSIRMHDLLPCCYVSGTAKQLRTDIQVSATERLFSTCRNAAGVSCCQYVRCVIKLALRAVNNV